MMHTYHTQESILFGLIGLLIGLFFRIDKCKAKHPLGTCNIPNNNSTESYLKPDDKRGSHRTHPINRFCIKVHSLEGLKVKTSLPQICEVVRIVNDLTENDLLYRFIRSKWEEIEESSNV